MDIDSVIKEKKQYNNFKNSVIEIIDYLDLAIDKLNDSISIDENLIMIDDYEVYKDKINNAIDELRKEKNYLSNSILPKVKDEINNLGNLIGY